MSKCLYKGKEVTFVAFDPTHADMVFIETDDLKCVLAKEITFEGKSARDWRWYLTALKDNTSIEARRKNFLKH